MKKYMKPIMNSEVFVTNEFIGACSDSALSCLNMNNATAVYKDLDKDGILDDNEKNDANKFTGWNYKNDCYMSGDSTSKNHILTQTYIDNAQRVLVVSETTSGKWPNQTTTTTVTSAIVVKSNETGSNIFSDSPHFISLKVANHS